MFSLVAMMATFAAITACSDDDDATSSAPQIAVIGNQLISGNWIVESLIEDGEDETADYTSYVLGFTNQGVVTATHVSDTALNRSGTYLLSMDDGKLELEMSFMNPGTIDDLDDDWYFVSQTGNTLAWADGADVLVLSQQ